VQNHCDHVRCQSISVCFKLTYCQGENIISGLSYYRNLTWISHQLSPKNVGFCKLMSNFLSEERDVIIIDSFLDEHIFLISSSNPWYGDILVYLQTLKLYSNYS
jgi:hypothetical protein